MMIKIVSMVLQLALPIVSFFFARSKKKAEMKEKMFDLAKKYDKQVLRNAKLNDEYSKLKQELEKHRRS